MTKSAAVLFSLAPSFPPHPTLSASPSQAPTSFSRTFSLLLAIGKSQNSSVYLVKRKKRLICLTVRIGRFPSMIGPFISWHFHRIGVRCALLLFTRCFPASLFFHGPLVQFLNRYIIFSFSHFQTKPDVEAIKQKFYITQ